MSFVVVVVVLKLVSLVEYDASRLFLLGCNFLDLILLIKS